MKLLQSPVFLGKSLKRHYIYELCIAFIFLCGIILQLSSCSEDFAGKNKIPEGGIPFKDGNINFVINFDSYGENDDISMRSATDMASETVVIPLDDDLSMFATLRNAPREVTTRSAMLRSFTNNAELHIVVYEHGALDPVYDQYAAYSVDAPIYNPTITRISATPITLDIGKMYRLVAFSRNTSTPITLIYPPTSPLGSSPNDSDLLWGVCDSLDITGPGTYNVTIVMRHLFSQVTVKASNSIGAFTGPGITGVEMAGYTAFMHVDSGRLEPDAAISQVFTGFSPTPPTLTSDPRLVYTGGDNSTVFKINSVEIDGITHPVQMPAIFSKQLKSGFKYDMELKIGNAKKLTDDPPPFGFIPYVGAFWKAGQTGERLIRIPRAPSGDADGTWSAVVIEGEDWIMLDKDWTSDTGIYGMYPETYESNLSFDLDNAVPNTASTVVTGTLRPSTAAGYQTNDEFIYFRIGLRNIHIPTPLKPARYGVVLLTYNNNYLRQRLFIRQGEEADFLMRPGDPDGLNASVPDNRSFARKFSPYNLTATILNASVDVTGTSPSVNPGISTGYPSQAGAMFQWAGKGVSQRFAYDAHRLSPLYWYYDTDDRVWSLIAAGYEACPPGYRRPNDGPEDIFNPSGIVSNSEMRQSLFLDPMPSDASSTTNSLYGYYADGFFDRHEILNGEGSSYGDDCSVRVGYPDIAHIGRLFYNPDNKASLFFPSSGYRRADYSGLQGMGMESAYWTGTVTDADYAWNLSLGVSVANLVGITSKDAALSLRCVASTLSGTPRNLWLSPSTDNDVKNLVITSVDPWVVESPVTNASLSASSGSGTTNITVTRSTTVFGLQTLILRNTVNDELAYVSIDNYYIEDDDVFYIPNNLLTNNTDAFEIDVYGGSETFVIIGVSDIWINASIDPDGKLRLTADQSPNQDPRSGTITIAHANDPTYQVTFAVEQDLYSDTAPFKFFVIRTTWALGDAEYGVEFVNNFMVSGPTMGQQVPFDNTDIIYNGANSLSRAMGYSLASILYLDGTRGSVDHNGYFNSTGTAGAGIAPLFSDQMLEEGLMFFGGDATSGQGETVFFNAPQITPPSRREDNTGLPREITLDIYISHRSSSTTVGTVTISTYEEGKMLKPTGVNGNTPPPGQLPINAHNFYNVDSTTTAADLLLSNAWSLLNAPSWFETRAGILKQGTNAAAFRTAYGHVATVVYDRYRRTARITWHGTFSSPSPSPSPIAPIMAPLAPTQPMTQEELEQYLAEKEAQTIADMQNSR